MYGGFSGTETERSQRDWIRNRTILSGERGDPTDPYDNVKSIIRGPSENGEALWDGFVISGASQSAVAAGSDISGYRESAFLVLDHCLLTGNASTNCQPVALYGYTRVRNSVITGNTQSFSSYDSASSCIARWCELDNCTVFGNAASYTVLHECTMHNTVVWGNTRTASPTTPSGTATTSLSSDWPLEGYGSDRWLAKNPQRTIGTTYKNTDPGFVTDEATGLACALDSDSYAVDKGRAISWMTDDSLDYLGNPRCYGDAPHLGAIEWFVPGPTAPEFQSVEIGTPDYDRISVETILKTLGNQSSYATLEAQVSTSSSFGTVAARERVRATAKKTPFSATVTGLDDNTAYYLRVVATGENGLTATSRVFSFTTPNLALPAFTVALSSESPTRGTVALSIRTLGSGANSASVSVTYSTSSDFSGAKTVSLGTAAAAGAFSGELTRLSQGTTYYVKVTLANNRNQTATVNAGSFTTQRAGGYVPGLMQAKTTCAKDSYPDFSFRASDDPNAEPAPGPFMADITGSGSPSAVNAFTGKTWAWADKTTYYYEGEMFFKGGVTYNFFHSIDDGAAIELDGEMFTQQSKASESGYNVPATFASKAYATDGWHAIRIWVYDWSGGKGYVSGRVGFNGVGIGWNTNGCTAVGSANQSRWSTLRDPADASFFRTLSGAALPSYVTLDDDLAIAGTTLTGTIRTEAVEDGCTVTLYAGQTDGGSNATAWAQSFPVGTVPTETYDLSFQWEDFCAAGDCDGWFVVARMTNASRTYEGWSVVRTPSVSGAFLVGIRDDGSAGLTTLKVSPRVVDFGDFRRARPCRSSGRRTPSSPRRPPMAGSATTTNWLSSVTLSGLSPATVYYVRAKGVDGTETAYSRKLQLSTLDYGAPVVSLSVGTPTLTTLPVTWTLSGLGLGNDSVELFLDWGTSASYGSTVSLGTFSAAASGSRTLEGLSPETVYHVRLRAVASPSHKEASTADRTGTTVAVGNPSVSAALVGDSTQFAQSFSWSLASLGTGASSATVYYDLSTSSDFSSGTRTVTLGSGLRAAAGATVDLSDLASETAYWLRVRAVNDARKEAVSSVLSFTTKPVGTPAVALSIGGITQRAATATIVVSSLGDAARSATIVLEWGTSTAYGSSVTVASGVTERGTFTQQISGLSPETAYLARVRVVNDANKTGSATAEFETLEPANPVFTHTVSPSFSAAGVSVQIERLGNGATSAAGFVRWFLDAALSNPAGTVALPAAYAPGAVSATMTGLGTATKYWYEVVVTNNLAGIAAQTNSFTTAAAGNVEIGTGYYEPGLIMGYRPNRGRTTRPRRWRP